MRHLVAALALAGLLGGLAAPMGHAQQGLPLPDQLFGQDQSGSDTAAEDAAEPVDDAPPPLPESDVAIPVVPPGPGPLEQAVDDFDLWQDVAARAELVVLQDAASLFALTRLREELFDWRETFNTVARGNAGRLATLQAQLEALGPAPEGTEEEPPRVAIRRAALAEAITELRAPRLLAAEAYARADGLIGEIDAQIRARDTQRLTTRGPSPLNPAFWPDAVAALRDSLAAVVADTMRGLRADLDSGAFWQNLPLALFYFVLALILMLRSRHWVLALEARITRSSAAAARALWRFLQSGLAFLLPFLGLLSLIAALRAIELWDARSADLRTALLISGTAIIVAIWLNRQLFPEGAGGGPLGYGPETRQAIRRTGMALGVGIGALTMLVAVMRLVEAEDRTILVVLLPLQILLSVLLFRMGTFLRTAPLAEDAPGETSGRTRRLIGLLASLVAVATPILSVLGYAAASQALFAPTVLTLAILGAVVVLQRFVQDMFTPDDVGEEAGPLLPVLIGFGLLILSLPVLALVWGARVTDLLELWTRFREGFQIGETRISPTDFLTFAVVFVLGYLLTRFIKTTLRNSVMPRTKLDLGGQNAILVGFGYLGIFISAIVAITMAGIDLSNLAILAGALSVGIGFGLQNIVQNFVSGIILLIERPIGEGDMIEVNGQFGYVKDISVRSTMIETFDKTDVIVPNADLVSGQVTNWTRGNPVGRLIVPVGVAYGVDVDKVRDILMEVAETHPMALANPAPLVFFMGFGDSSLNFEIRVMLRDIAWKIVTLSEMNFEIYRRLADAGVEIPFPQRDLWLRNPETLHPRPDAAEANDAGGAPPDHAPSGDPRPLAHPGKRDDHGTGDKLDQDGGDT